MAVGRSVKLPLFLAIGFNNGFLYRYDVSLWHSIHFMSYSRRMFHWRRTENWQWHYLSLIGVGLAAFWLLPVFSALLESKAVFRKLHLRRGIP